MIQIIGEVINLRSVDLNDASYIISLRTNKEINKFLSKTSEDLESQKKWLKNYLIREKKQQEIYFLINDNLTNRKCGTVRIYDINKKEKSCTWGSFILDKNRPKGAAYEVIDLTIKYIIEKLKIKNIYLDVRRENKKAIYIYEKSGFKKYKEDEDNYYYKKFIDKNGV